jgi:hypothetical protein
MKHKAVLLGIAGILLAGIAGWNLSAAAGKDQRAEISVGRGYVVGGVKLEEGKYLVLHKDMSAHEGEACTFFYKMPYRSDKEPVAKMRCTLGQGTEVKEFTLRSVTQPDGTSAVRSIQFPNSSEVHNFGAGS